MSTELTWLKSSYSNTEGGECIEVALSWRKSTYSDTEGSACIEVALPWRKSTYSGTGGGDCIEVATCSHAVHVRDSKLKDGPQLAVPAPSWAAFVAYATLG